MGGAKPLSDSLRYHSLQAIAASLHHVTRLPWAHLGRACEGIQKMNSLVTV
jgi:hypothetical protein